jgi:C4-dicarboxylate-specific signal transduction histidine kinase
LGSPIKLAKVGRCRMEIQEELERNVVECNIKLRKVEERFQAEIAEHMKAADLLQKESERSKVLEVIDRIMVRDASIGVALKKIVETLDFESLLNLLEAEVKK